MKKTMLIGLITTLLVLGSISVAFAQNVPTEGNAQTGTSNLPIIKAKAEWIYRNNSVGDDDPTKPYLQVNPPMGYGATVTLKYLVVATDYDGYDDLSSAYADVIHPDGSPKYQVALTNVVSCTDNSDQLEKWIGILETAYEKGLVTFNEGSNGTFTINDTIAELRQCSAKLFYGTADLSYCQMCGEFEWELQCSGTPPCTGTWVAINRDNGYKVDAYVFDQSGGKSGILTNYFEYICQAGLETDFNKLDYQSVLYRVHKWIEGDRIWNSLGSACNPLVDSNCIPPTIRNIGNIPTNVSVMEDDMQFGNSTQGWNVQWDARLGNFNEHATSTFNPYQTVTLDGTIGLCQLDKISFSIYANKIVSTGSHRGNATIEAVPVSFPWWE